jgi:glycine/D-amino acid oxidase-like deaminating enzyme
MSKIVVLGGGVIGLSTAMLLTRQGHDVTAFERDAALHLPDSCIDLNVGATVESASGQGIDTLLTQHGLAAARAAGYDRCVADWRTANLLAARFWPRRSFREVVYRLRRRVDQRIAWANWG